MNVCVYENRNVQAALSCRPDELSSNGTTSGYGEFGASAYYMASMSDDSEFGASLFG